MLRKRYIDAPAKTFDEYLEASFNWESLKWEVGEYFTRYDIFLCPQYPCPPTRQGREEFVIDGKTMGARHSLRARSLGPDRLPRHERSFRLER